MQNENTIDRTIPILVIMVLAWFTATYAMTMPQSHVLTTQKIHLSEAQIYPVPEKKPEILTVKIDKIQRQISWPEPSRNKAAYPIPGWARSLNANSDAALILAIAHQESRFNPNAVSPMGAVGLMQLLPSTAEFVSGMRLKTDYASASGFTPPIRIGTDLKDPHTNIQIGQKYIHYLRKQPHIGNNLVYLLAAYNAGPGAVEQWQKRAPKDPLLYINSIPYGETRAYVKKVMTNYWMYRQLLGKKDQTLNQLLKGKMPRLAKV